MFKIKSLAPNNRPINLALNRLIGLAIKCTILLIMGSTVTAAEASTPDAVPDTQVKPALADDAAISYCKSVLAQLPGEHDKELLFKTCSEVNLLPSCQSIQGKPIFHFDRAGTDKSHGKRILAISLIHGDELPAGTVTRSWISRLSTIDPRNSWRVIPVVNPDGVATKTRFNANKIDLNRNFPSKDWNEKALKYWADVTKKDPRRFPGNAPASEPETQCLVTHIEEFKPDFVISIHTPLGVLDFDGPRVAQPGFKPLPWVGLGNYSGSLGRYMWVDKKIPVLTIELKGNSGIKKLEDFDRLQDISGTVAIQASKMLEQQKR